MFVLAAVGGGAPAPPAAAAAETAGAGAAAAGQPGDEYFGTNDRRPIILFDGVCNL